MEEDIAVTGDMIAEVVGYREGTLKMVNSRTKQYFQQCTMTRIDQVPSARKYFGNFTEGIFLHTYLTEEQFPDSMSQTLQPK